MSKSSERIDKFLWSVRVYKTRSLAGDACKNGRVLINNTTIKPSRLVVAGDVITVKKMPVLYTFKCIAIPSSRVGAKLVADYLENNTPEEELQKLEVKVDFNIGHRRRGSGRPTKRERRDIDRLKNS